VTHTGLREQLRRREPLTAAFLDLGSPVSAEVTAMSGFDAVVVDLEHGAGDEAAARAQIAAAGPHAAVVVRVPDGTGQAGRMLDAGADGVIVPQVGSVEEARRAGAAVRYAGAGRGISPFSRGNRYGAAGADFRPRADERVACIVQIERASALDAVDAIAALDDVDALLMGPADLSNDLGCELDLACEPLQRAARDIGGTARPPRCTWPAPTRPPASARSASRCSRARSRARCWRPARRSRRARCERQLRLGKGAATPARSALLGAFTAHIAVNAPRTADAAGYVASPPSKKLTFARIHANICSCARRTSCMRTWTRSTRRSSSGTTRRCAAAP
jgi:2-keto-3-deoxy-L-rhamnonate aldolase RhmA